MASNVDRMAHLPSGVGVCTTIPDILYLPELIIGGLVWILVACTYVEIANPLGWVMCVSVFCFAMTFIWLMVFACGSHYNSGGWATADFIYHFIATVFYLSASVELAFVTLALRYGTTDKGVKDYKLCISAVVFSFTATFLYFVHTILSAIRWKSF
ncbi:myelin and lymphocyte protein [Nematolebias whitei]|uniref:myelin and lymphocyte protein n=1 Tax=Nematolebias whitei TaxID=451745 RepID=UPI001897C04A|nr:myelin and lymphocyte protein [Nematolebias whitei]